MDKTKNETRGGRSRFIIAKIVIADKTGYTPCMFVLITFRVFKEASRLTAASPDFLRLFHTLRLATLLRASAH